MSNNIYDNISKILSEFYSMTDAILAKLTAPVSDVELASNAKTLNGETASTLIKSLNEDVRNHIALKNNPHGLTAHLLGGVTKSEADALNNTMSMGWFPVSLLSASENIAGSGESTDFVSLGAINPTVSQFTFQLKRPWRACMAGLVETYDTISIDFSKCPHFQAGEMKVYLMSNGTNLYFDVFPEFQPETMKAMYVGKVTITDTTIKDVYIASITRLGTYAMRQESKLGSSIVMETSSVKLSNWSTK